MVLSLLFGSVLSAFASDRPVAAFPMANRVIIESRADGSVRLRSCKLPWDRSEPPITCTELGVSLPDEPASHESFDRQLRIVFDELELRAVRAEHRWFLMEAAAGTSIAATVGFEAARVYRRFGRRLSPSELKTAFYGIAPLGLFAGGMFAVGEYFLHRRTTTLERLLVAFGRATPAKDQNPRIVYNDYSNAYGDITHILDRATRAAAAQLSNPAP